MTDRARKRRAAWRKTNKLNGTFNTHEAVKALKSSGFDEKQAESVVETINKAVNETVATKSDLEVQGVKIDALRETVEGVKENIEKNLATKVEISKLETRMMRMMIFQTLVLVGLLIPIIAKLLL